VIGFERVSEIGACLREILERQPHAERSPRDAGRCTACGFALRLHFTDPGCSGTFVGCAGAHFIRLYLLGHDLPLPDEVDCVSGPRLNGTGDPPVRG
jgi:hypothetical protein